MIVDPPIIHPPGSRVRLTPSVCPPATGVPLDRQKLPPDGTIATVIAVRGDDRVVEVLDGEWKGARWIWDPKNLISAA